MTIISTEMLKWKRNKTVLGIFILTAILGIFAVERAFSISRSSSLMNSVQLRIFLKLQLE